MKVNNVILFFKSYDLAKTIAGYLQQQQNNKNLFHGNNTAVNTITKLTFFSAINFSPFIKALNTNTLFKPGCIG